MCAPIIAAGLAVAATAVSTIATNQAISAQNKQVQASNDLRKKEIDQATTQEINARLREMRREQSRIQVAAGEAGLNTSGGSIDALLMDSAMQAQLANNTSLANRESRKLSADAEAQSAMQSQSTFLGSALKIGLAGGSAYLGAKNPKGLRIT